MESIKNRRTIRKYRTDEVPDALLNSLLGEAFRASTMGNMQLYSVVVTRDAAMKEALAPAHFGQPMVTEAPVVLTFCADFHRFTRWCEERNATPGYDNFLSFMNAVQDTLLAVQNFCTLAEEAGLGLCYLGTTLYNPDAIIRTLHLPRLVVPVATITLGYPAETPAQPERLPLEALVHHEVYGEYSAERINALYAAKEAMLENRHFVEINHKENLAQVFTDLRYRKEDNEAMSKTLWDTLVKQGFGGRE
jgi:nitroreductase